LASSVFERLAICLSAIVNDLSMPIVHGQASGSIETDTNQIASGRKRCVMETAVTRLGKR
jgi:hypothetical protein